jgi:hypothetical protein
MKKASYIFSNPPYKKSIFLGIYLDIPIMIWYITFVLVLTITVSIAESGSAWMEKKGAAG